MPCYNAAGTLNGAVKSLLDQTLIDFEVVAVNDGSTDRTDEILAAWAQADDRIRIVDRPHLGIVSSLNTGLSFCRAEYIARMDADDRSHPERLSLQAAFLAANPRAAVVSCLVRGFPSAELRAGYRIYIEWLNSLLSDEDIRREMFVESPIPHPSAMLRKQWLDRIGGYQEHGWAEDYDLWLRLYLEGAHFAKIPQVLLDWRDHGDRLTRTDGRYALENFLRAKAHYLAAGPLADRDAVIIWGAGMIGRRISKHLLREAAPLKAFVDIDPKKIGRTRRGLPIIDPGALPNTWDQYAQPVILAAVGARGARRLIRTRLKDMGFVEGKDWWGVA
jgi:glycosyltransferase involved in cell wall biosynthesis